MRKIIFLTTLVCTTLLLSNCKKEFKPAAESVLPTENDARLKINFVSAYQRNPSVQIAVNNIRVSNLITARTPFPGGGYNTNGDNRPDYLKTNSGTMPVSISIPKAGTNTDSVNLFSGSISLTAGKYYSLHVTDTATNTKMILVEDDVTNADTGSSKYRFINLMPNVPAVDFYYGTTVVAANVPYLTITPPFTMKVPVTALAWTIREAGASPTSAALATYTSVSTSITTRTYVVFTMGYKGITGATDPRRPFVAFYHTR